MSRAPHLLFRFAVILAGWTVLLYASPGMLVPDGSLVLAILGVGIVGSVIVRPLGPKPKRALFLEWVAGGSGLALSMWWVWFVVPPGLLYVAGGFGVYTLIAGWMTRRLARRFPTGVSVALAWLGAETLRTVLLPPLGLGWFLLGHYTHHQLWISGSARIWGVEGLTFVVAALGGLVAEVLLERRAARASALLAGAALTAAVLFSAVTGPVPMVQGPRVLIVQPSITQEAKQYGDPIETYEHLCELTLAALAERAERGAPAVDLIAWGETMLQMRFAEPTVRAAIERGIGTPHWRDPVTLGDLDRWELIEESYVGRRLLDRFPFPTPFLTGAEVLDVVGDELRYRNAVLLFDREGRRGPAAAKRFLVPGAETMLGLERFEFIRVLAKKAMGYIPDFLPGETTGVMEFELAEGGRRRFGASVCFDNSFLAAYSEPLLDGPLDFHAVLTNEAWYYGSFELDQMLAFSRIAALATGRSLLRVANSGVSLLIGPDGREIDRLRIRGEDRSVAGTLTVRIPVPRDPGAGPPPYPRLRSLWRGGIGLLTLILLLLARSGLRAEE